MKHWNANSLDRERKLQAKDKNAIKVFTRKINCCFIQLLPNWVCIYFVYMLNAHPSHSIDVQLLSTIKTMHAKVFMRRITKYNSKCLPWIRCRHTINCNEDYVHHRKCTPNINGLGWKGIFYADTMAIHNIN